MSSITASDAGALHDVDHVDHGDHGSDHPATATGVSNEKLAMWIFLGSECLLFGALIATYLVYRGQSISGPTGTDVFDIPFTSLSSFVLLMSSLTMVLAVTATRRGDMRRSRIWLIVTALLGSVFIGGQIYEFTTFYKEGVTLSGNLFGSTFYVLTGFHGVHVTVGILMLFSSAFMSWRGRITRKNWESIEIVGLYWHFVDVVWILIFTVIYLIK
jgi:heme/copper-type cytochrome/quinol oxidase subunit 3